MKKIVLAAFVLISLIGCSSDNNEQTGGANNTPVELEFTTLKKGDGSGSNAEITPYYYIIRTDQKWNDFKFKVKTFSNTVVNFSNYEVIAVFDQYRHELGYDIEITSVTKLDGKVTVKIKKTEPQEGEPVPALDSQPYHAVTIKKTGLPVVFEENQPQ